jgi:hypothetical protein
MQKSTIEMEHKKNISKYVHDPLNLESVQCELSTLKEHKKTLSSLKEILEANQRINELEDQMSSIASQTDEIDYLLNVVPILNKYNDDNQLQTANNSIFNNFVKQSRGKEKGALYNEYMNVVENTPMEIVKQENVYVCYECNVAKVLSVLDSCMICPKCGISETYFDTGLNNLSYEQEVNSEGNVTFAYKRINHFSEWLAQFQAKESIDIPVELLDKLRTEFHKEKIKKVTDITKTKVKQYLKKLKYNKYYEHVPHITNLLTGLKPPSITPTQEEKLRNMFRDIQSPFDEHKPKDRSNFLSYSYCLYKFCELLGYDDLLCNFPLLKSREKLHQQDVIWQKICNSLGWQYIATV